MTHPDLTRRGALGVLAALAAAPALAGAPARSARPEHRPGSGAAAAPPAPGAPATAAQIAAARLGGQAGCAVIDAGSGAVLDAVAPDLELPPASVAKAATALYALDRLGAAHRFATRVLALGPVAGGRVQGDLILAGGGDPTLTTDGLGDLAAALRARGVQGVTGRFLVHAGALPQVPRIDDDQPAHAGYNPAIAGLNLNFNRVHFEWRRSGAGWQVQLDARGERFVPAVRGATMRVVERERPLFALADQGGIEAWTVAAAALGQGGSRWLPVRRPADHSAEVFRTLAAAQGVALPEPAPALGALPAAAAVLAERHSDPLPGLLRDMLRHSTNLTAEVVGLTASGAGSLRASAAAMSEWIAGRFGVRAAFVDHSGLGAAARIAPVQMARLLVPVRATLAPLLRPLPVTDREGGASVLAKTGTLNFVSCLAGYAAGPTGRPLAFAIFAADLPRRAAIPPGERERPPGGAEWTRRARAMQARIVAGWAGAYG